MAIKAKLKFRGDMPWELEHKLIGKYGFVVFSRFHKEWVILEKRKKPFLAEVLINGELPEDVQNTLNKRCSTIVNCFVDPDANEKIVRIRLNNMASVLPPLQKKYVHEWIVRNFGEENAKDSLYTQTNE